MDEKSNLPIVPPRPAKYPPPSRGRSNTERKLRIPTPTPKRRNTESSIEYSRLSCHSKQQNEIAAIVENWIPKTEENHEMHNHNCPGQMQSHESKRKILRKILSNHHVQHKHTFGTNLTQLTDEGYNVPIVLFLCIEFLTINSKFHFST